MDLTTFKQKLQNFDINTTATNVTSIIGASQTTGILQATLIVITIVASLFTLFNARRKEAIQNQILSAELQSKLIDNQIKQHNYELSKSSKESQ